jgi:hypothetical protein
VTIWYLRNKWNIGISVLDSLNKNFNGVYYSHDDREGVKLKVNHLHSIDFTIQIDLNDYQLVMDVFYFLEIK